VSATQSEFARFRDMPGAVVAALRLRRQLRHTPGAIGVSLAMRPLRRRSWSVSAWESEADLHRFLRSAPHRATVRRYRDHMRVMSELWRADRFDLDDAWREVSQRFAS
jgi:heme-degrading monooxygenase HmoA